MADSSCSRTNRKRSSFATKHFQRKLLKIFDLYPPLGRLLSFVARIITCKVRCWVSQTITANRCGTRAALPTHSQPSYCTQRFISQECASYIIAGGQDQWPWKCSYCKPATRPASQDPHPSARSTTLHAPWIVWSAVAIWPPTGHLLIWSPCSLHPHTGQKEERITILHTI